MSATWCVIPGYASRLLSSEIYEVRCEHGWSHAQCQNAVAICGVGGTDKIQLSIYEYFCPTIRSHIQLHRLALRPETVKAGLVQLAVRALEESNFNNSNKGPFGVTDDALRPRNLCEGSLLNEGLTTSICTETRDQMTYIPRKLER